MRFSSSKASREIPSPDRWPRRSPRKPREIAASSVLVLLRGTVVVGGSGTVARCCDNWLVRSSNLFRSASYLDWISRLLCSIRSYASSILLSRSSTLSDGELGRLGVEGMGAGRAGRAAGAKSALAG